MTSFPTGPSAPSSICFSIRDENFYTSDIQPEHAIWNQDFLSGLISLVKFPDAKFINCQFNILLSTGNLSLESCTAKAVIAAGNVIVKNSSIISIDAREVAILGSSKIKKVDATRTYTDTAMTNMLNQN